MNLSFARRRKSITIDVNWIDSPEAMALSPSQFRESIRLMCALHASTRKPLLWRSRRMLERLVLIWGRACAYCGDRAERLEVEHMVPLSRGGHDRLENMTLACRDCNQRKGTKTPSEFGVLPEVHFDA